MTEEEWLKCDSSRSLLAYAEMDASRRRIALYHAACCSSFTSDWEDGHPILDAISLVEARADNPVLRAEDRSRVLERSRVSNDHLWELVQETRGKLRHRVLDAAKMAVAYLLLTAALDDEYGWWRSLVDIDDRLTATHHALTWGRLEQVCDENIAHLRDIFGNPFRPVAFSPEWRTDTVVTLARTMYESREFGAMPILADALQDAGCDNDDILNHCREPGTHVRGCWVVDLVLGKE
jgi:hypothetical protein